MHIGLHVHQLSCLIYSLFPQGIPIISKGDDFSLFSYYDKSMNRETIDGQPVTEEHIKAWAHEAEAGYPVEQLRKRGRQPLGDGPSAVVPVRIDSALLDALGEKAERENVSRSEAIRTAIRAWVGAA
jgi:predicted transcriptional regulator